MSGILLIILAVLCYALGSIQGHRAGVKSAYRLAIDIRRILNEKEKQNG